MISTIITLLTGFVAGFLATCVIIVKMSMDIANKDRIFFSHKPSKLDYYIISRYNNDS